MLKQGIAMIVSGAAAAAAWGAPARPAPVFRLGQLPTVHLRTGPIGAAKRLRAAPGSGMVELLPFDRGRFHLLAGGRIAGRMRGSDAERGRLIALPRGTGARLARRYAPMVTMGVQRTLIGRTSLGIDSGVALGRLDAPPLQANRIDPAEGRANAIGRVTLRYRF